MTRSLVAPVVVLMLSGAGCGGNDVAPGSARTPLLQRIAPEDLNRLAAARIAFGHQSVGYDILAGVADLARDNPALKLTVLEATSMPEDGALVHFRAGQNEQPLTKIDDFVRFVDAHASRAPDLAMLKFCYIDVNPSTDVKAVFDRYRGGITALRARHPQTRFVHMTMPLRTIQTGWKVGIKNLLGRPIGGYAENTKRQQYNELLRSEYGGREAVFDLAALQSTRADGSRLSFTNDNTTAFALAPEYTYDGGHLNENGRRYVAEQFLATLAEAIKVARTP